MQAYGRRLLLRDTTSPLSHVFTRQASLTGAINRGIRKTQRGVETALEGVRNNRSDVVRGTAPWSSKNDARPGRYSERAKGWQGDVEQYGRERSRFSGDRDDFDGSDQRPRRAFNSSKGDGGGFNRDNADRRVRYEERKGGFRERGPPPNRDQPNREQRRRAQFGEPYSGKPQHDQDFMERHIRKDAVTRNSRSRVNARSDRTSSQYEDEMKEESEFEEDYTKASKNGWTAEDVEREWSLRKPDYQPDFTRARDVQRTRFKNLRDSPRINRHHMDGQGSSEQYQRGNETTGLSRGRREPSQERFRESQALREQYISKDEPGQGYRQMKHRNDPEDPEDLDKEVGIPSLEQRRNKFRPARKLERSLIDVETTSKISTAAPASVPFTTAASTFLWGTFSVQEAIRASRRTLYTLYIYRGQSIEAPTTPESYHLISKLALSRGCRVKEISGEGWSRLLNKMTGSRPHNGWVLEASEIPKLPITSFNHMNRPKSNFEVSLGHQSAEDAAITAPLMESGSSPNSGTAIIPSFGFESRYPLVLLLDRIMDPGNLGAIVRSAHFLGVDALLVLEHSSAPFNAVTLKVAAGAAEYLPILTVKNEHDLVKSSQKNGWSFFAAISPISEGAVKAQDQEVATALSKGPCVLMLGSEGEGVRPHLQKLADGVASIKNARGENGGIDSLNVSVASALLCQDFLRGPHVVATAKEAIIEEGDSLEDVGINDSFKEIAVGESETDMVERQEDKVF